MNLENTRFKKFFPQDSEMSWNSRVICLTASWLFKTSVVFHQCHSYNPPETLGTNLVNEAKFVKCLVSPAYAGDGRQFLSEATHWVEVGLGAKFDLCFLVVASWSTSALKLLSYTQFPKAVGTRCDYLSIRGDSGDIVNQPLWLQGLTWQLGFYIFNHKSASALGSDDSSSQKTMENILRAFGLHFIKIPKSSRKGKYGLRKPSTSLKTSTRPKPDCELSWNN